MQAAHGHGVLKEFVLNIRWLFLVKKSQVIAIFLRCALCSAALVVPACEGIGFGIGFVRALACAVRHLLAVLFLGTRKTETLLDVASSCF